MESMENFITKKFIPEGRKNRPGKIMLPIYITVHDTANPGATAANHADYLLSDAAAAKPVSWHFTVDNQAIFQHLPINETAYHAGDGNGPGNTQSIGIEICEFVQGDIKALEQRHQAELNAIRLIVHLIKTVPSLNNNLQCIKQHNFFSPGQNCPRVLRQGNRWKDFLKLINVFIAEEKEEKSKNRANNIFQIMEQINQDKQEKLLSLPFRDLYEILDYLMQVFEGFYSKEVN